MSYKIIVNSSYKGDYNYKPYVENTFKKFKRSNFNQMLDLVIWEHLTKDKAREFKQILESDETEEFIVENLTQYHLTFAYNFLSMNQQVENSEQEYEKMCKNISEILSIDYFYVDTYFRYFKRG